MLNRLAAAVLSLAILLDFPGGGALLFAAGSSVLEGVDVGADQVAIRLSDPVKYNPFATADPPRLVIELLNTEYPAGSKTVPGRGEVLKKVRFGQFLTDPTPISRIVLDLAKPAAYQIRWEGRSLLVQMAGAPSSPAEEAPQAVEKPLSAAVGPAPEKTSPPKPPRPVVVAQTSAAPPAEAKPKAPAAETPEPKAVKPPLPAGYSTELAEIARTADAGQDEEGPAPKPAASRPPQGGARSRRDILSSLSGEPITLEYDNTDIRDVLKHMAEKARINIIHGADVSGPVTLRLVDVPFSEAFMTLLQMNGLVADQAGENVLRIMTPSTLTKERSVAVYTTRVIRLKYSKAADLKASIDAVRSAEGRMGKLTADDTSNSLIVTDTIDGIASVERLLAKLDVRPQQVMIEAKLVEVKLTKDLYFGIQWDYFSMNNGRLMGQEGTNLVGAVPSLSSTDKPFDADYTYSSPSGGTGRGTGVFLPASKIFGALTLGRVTNNYFLSATLTAAAAQGKVKILSDPKIATLNGKKATINITTSIPYVTSNVASTGVTSQTLGTITTGIQLEVTPTINADGRITVDVKPTVSQPSATVASSVTGVPATDSRTAQTTVIVQDGETVVIGGLITDSVNNAVAKIPFLGDIPIIGWLFKKKIQERSRVELLIFVTPHVLPS
jgi:type IV pilus assembly protein PilQ